MIQKKVIGVEGTISSFFRGKVLLEVENPIRSEQYSTSVSVYFLGTKKSRGTDLGGARQAQLWPMKQSANNSELKQSRTGETINDRAYCCCDFYGYLIDDMSLSARGPLIRQRSTGGKLFHCPFLCNNSTCGTT